MQLCDLLCALEIAPGRDGRSLVLSQAAIDQVGTQPIHGSDLALLTREPAPDQVLYLVKTSGSTGRPKVLPVTVRAARRMADDLLYLPNDPGYDWNFINLYDFTLASVPREIEIALRHGKTAVSSTLATFLDDARRFDACHATLMTGDATRLSLAVPDDWTGPRRIALWVKGGPLSPRVRSVLRERVATHVYHPYSSNESHRVSLIDETGVGTIFPGMRVRIIDGAGSELPFGSIGGIETAPAITDRYLWGEAATRLAFRDGWYRTGDVGYQPDADHLVVLGREDDVLNLGGLKIMPAPMEAYVRTLDGVEDAVLLSMPDRSGVDVIVVVETQAQALSPAMTGTIAAYLAGLEAPVLCWPMTDLPRTETGKVRRLALRQRLAPTIAARGIA